MSKINKNRSGGAYSFVARLAGTLALPLVAVGAAMSAQAAVVDLGGGTTEITTVGDNVLTSGGAFTDVNVTLAPDAPKWARGVSVVNGEIVLDVKSLSTYIFVR